MNNSEKFSWSFNKKSYNVFTHSHNNQLVFSHCSFSFTWCFNFMKSRFCDSPRVTSNSIANQQHPRRQWLYRKWPAEWHENKGKKPTSLSLKMQDSIWTPLFLVTVTLEGVNSKRTFQESECFVHLQGFPYKTTCIAMTWCDVNITISIQFPVKSQFIWWISTKRYARFCLSTVVGICCRISSQWRVRVVCPNAYFPKNRSQSQEIRDEILPTFFTKKVGKFHPAFVTSKTFERSFRCSPMCANGSNFELGSSVSHDTMQQLSRSHKYHVWRYHPISNQWIGIE